MRLLDAVLLNSLRLDRPGQKDRPTIPRRVASAMKRRGLSLIPQFRLLIAVGQWATATPARRNPPLSISLLHQENPLKQTIFGADALLLAGALSVLRSPVRNHLRTVTDPQDAIIAGAEITIRKHGH